jgi:hypothetical protein
VRIGRITDRLLGSIEDAGGTDLARHVQRQREQIRNLNMQVGKAQAETAIVERQLRDAALVIDRQKAEIARLKSLVPSEGAR